MLTCITSGSMTVEAMLMCIEGARRAGEATVAFLRLAVEQKATREAQTLWST